MALYRFTCRRFPSLRLHAHKIEKNHMVEFEEKQFETDDERERDFLRAHEWYGGFIREIGVHDQFKNALQLTIPANATLDDIKEAMLVAQMRSEGLPTQRPQQAERNDEIPALSASEDIEQLVEDAPPPFGEGDKEVNVTRGAKGTGPRQRRAKGL
jgi:hypothetical protein